MTAQTYLIEIHPDDCAELLATSTCGRLGVIVDGRPEIFPVNHVYDRLKDCVVFPTNARTKLHAALNWPWVAFEVDGLHDEGGGCGWSVLVVGRAEEITDPEEVARMARERHVPWRSGDTERWVRIVPSKVTGRTILASENGITIRLSGSPPTGGAEQPAPDAP
jgi:nitroimidazol reductase NimA-like FMN-containing flavoprotein (pyridoxamine 5'-phosphate oxidase superfamily)